MNIGLRIDADTFRGTRLGVPALIRRLEYAGIRASFFFSVGPDNMGRHIWRMIRPDFLRKMWRTRAPALYGWDILAKGVLWPGPVIGQNLRPVIRAARDSGHEIGLHAWDHQAWQAGIDGMDPDAIRRHLRQGFDALADITGQAPVCSAAPGWKCNDLVLAEKERFPFIYNSDCRGHSVFLPVAGGQVLTQPQVPVTLPTFDEVVGRNGVTRDTFNSHLLSLLKPESLMVLSIHAESEGIGCLNDFCDFIERVKAMGGRFVPLSALVPPVPLIPRSQLGASQIPGREGWVAMQRD